MILISSDKDFNQLLSNNLRIYNPRKDEMIRMDNCKELFGYHSHETVEYLAMVGDTSDDIPGFPGIGPVKARKILMMVELRSLLPRVRTKNIFKYGKGMNS